jgi:ribosomal protein S18 acetylase RimI-like enzyme
MRKTTTTTKFRIATDHDKDYVLGFCKNTFSWGDYIDRVWDIWITEPNSIFLVAVNVNENKIEKPIAISHGILIPEKIIWIEGIRVDPEYRSHKLATNMSIHILDYARKNGAVYSSAIVSISNEKSKGLMEKLGFKVISTWSYLSIKPVVLPELNNNFITDNSSSSTIKVAKLEEYQSVLNYLNKSNIFKASGKKFVNSWRWYDLTEDILRMMINNKQVIILVNNDLHEDNKSNKEKGGEEKKVRGIAIIDEEGYWNNQNILQIVYIDADSDELLLSLVNKSLELSILKENNKNDKKKKYFENNKYERMQIFTPFPIKKNSLIFQKFNVNFSEQFLLYHKEI